MLETDRVKVFRLEGFQSTLPAQSKENAFPVHQFMANVYLWMTIGLLVSCITGFTVSNQPQLANLFQDKHYLLMFVFMLQMGVIQSIERVIKKLDPWALIAAFLGYSVVTGFTFSYAFMAYNLSSLLSVFFVTSMMFVVMAVIGYTVKKDVKALGTFAVMGGTGMCLLLVVSMVLHSQMIQQVASLVALLMIIGMTTTQVQRIKERAETALADNPTDTSMHQKQVIFSALTLYMGYMGMFQFLLRLVGLSKQH
jgi:FtsH-binding integral membrane protein